MSLAKLNEDCSIESPLDQTHFPCCNTPLVCFLSPGETEARAMFESCLTRRRRNLLRKAPWRATNYYRTRKTQEHFLMDFWPRQKSMTKPGKLVVCENRYLLAYWIAKYARVRLEWQAQYCHYRFLTPFSICKFNFC